MSLQPRRLVGEQPCVLDHHREVGAAERHALVRADRRTERDPLAGIPDALLEARLREPDRDRGDRDATVVEDGEELTEAVAFGAERVRHRHPAVGRSVNGWVSDACHPIFRYEGSTVNPGVPAGTMIAVISRAAPVRAVTVTSAVIGVPEFVMNAFDAVDAPTRRPRDARASGSRRRRCRRRTR